MEQTTIGNTIVEIIEQTDSLRMVLLGGAGLGKTTELQQVAWEISKRKKFPIFLSLSNYTSKTNIENIEFLKSYLESIKWNMIKSILTLIHWKRLEQCY